MSSHPAHTTRARFSLASLMHRRANPARVQKQLGERFATVAVYYVHGQSPYYYALVCRDAAGAIRLAVLFWHNLGHGWIYEPYAAKEAARLRLEEPA